MIAISVTENSLEAFIDNCFGKSKYYVIFDLKYNRYDFIDNPGLQKNICSGREAALYLIKKGVKTVISGNFGIKVKNIFDRNNIQIVIISNKFKKLNEIPLFNNIQK